MAVVNESCVIANKYRLLSSLDDVSSQRVTVMSTSYRRHAQLLSITFQMKLLSRKLGFRIFDLDYIKYDNGN